MRTATALLVMLSLGCSRETGPSSATAPKRFRLTLDDLHLEEDRVPTLVRFRVVNQDHEPWTIDSVQLAVTAKSVLFDDDHAGQAPSGLDCRLLLLDEHGKPLPDGQEIGVAPGATVEVVAALEWQLQSDPPPMLAIVQANFALARQDKPYFMTEPVAFILQSEPGALDAVLAATGQWPEGARRVLAVLNQHAGTRSPGFEALHRRIAAASERY